MTPSSPLAPARTDPTARYLASRPRPPDAGRLPPQDLAAERAILGACLLDPSAIARIRETLGPEHFYRDAHARTFEAVVSLHDEGRTPDLISVADRLRTRGHLDMVGGPAGLSALMDTVPASVHIEAHARIVKEKATLRRVGNLATDLSDRAWSEGADVAGLLAEAEGAFAGLAALSVPGEHGLVSDSAETLLRLDLPPREYVIGRWLPARGSAMIFGPTGIGKTKLGLTLASAVAAGGRFLAWEAPRPRSVLYVDGELPVEEIRERLADAIRTGPYQVGDRLRIITPDRQPRGVPNLATTEGQALVERHLDGVDLLILDSLATLCVSDASLNEPESWREMQAWILRLRRRGTAVVFHHHTGKSGKQLGTVTREFVLDATIELRLPDDYQAADGARFEVRFQKHRGRREPSEVEPFEARLVEAPDGRPAWTTKTCEAAVYERIMEMAREGISQTDIATEVGRNKSTVCRALKRAREEGRL